MRFIKEYIKSIYGYFLGFLGLILVNEFVLKLFTTGLKEAFFGYLFFLPGEAMIFVVLSGLFKNSKKNILITSLLAGLLWIFYSSQLIYHGNFGSFYSVNLIKMGGEALGNFWWAIVSTIVKKVPVFIGTLVFTVLVIVLYGRKMLPSCKIAPVSRAVCIVMALLLFYMGYGFLSLFGTGRGSAYYILNNSYSDTDSSVEMLGALTTMGLESEAAVFGKKSEPVKISVEKVVYEPTPDVLVKEDVSFNDISENNKVEEEAPVIKSHSYYGDIDFSVLKTKTDDETTKSLLDYFSVKEPETYNDFTGLLEGYNLIYICAESFSNYAMDPRVTPLLCEMSKNGIVLNNYYTSYKNTTTNGEFAFSTGLWADVSRFAADGNDVGSFARSSDNYMPYGLGHIFKNEGLTSYAYHGYISSYYKRGESWPNLGYENIKFMYEGLEFDNKWSPTDRELMLQSVEDYIDDERFFTYYMTYSGHGSYTTDTYIYLKNNEEVRKLLEGDNYDDEAIAYYCGSYELEKAMEYLTERLEEKGKLDDTLIVLASDHVPCSLSGENMEYLSKKNGFPFDWNFDMYKSTCIMYTKSLSKPIVSDEFCCNVDILPTVLNLLNLDYDSRFIMGNDIFGNSVHRARLYNGNFLTDRVRYNASKGVAKWTDKGEEMTDEEKSEFLEYMINYTENEYAVSTAIVDGDFYRFLKDNISE